MTKVTICLNFIYGLYELHSVTPKMKDPKKLGKKLKSWDFAYKTLNFGLICINIVQLIAKLYDKSHYMYTFYLRLIQSA